MPLVHTEYMEFLKAIMPLFYYSGVYEGILKEDADYNDFIALQNYGVLVDCKDALFNQPLLIGNFLNDNKHLLEKSTINIITDIKRFIRSEFVIYKYLENSFIAIDIKTSKVYEVRDLTDPLPDLVPGFPLIATTVIMPYNKKIVYDGFLEIKGELNTTEKQEIITECERMLKKSKIITYF